MTGGPAGIAHLLSAAAAAAQQITANASTALPVSARQDAAAFPGVERSLQGAAAAAEVAARQAIGAADDAAAPIARWKSGDSGGRAEVLASLRGVLAQTQQALGTVQQSVSSTSAYRDRVLADERSVAAAEQQIAAAAGALRAEIRDKEHDIERQKRRLAVLRALPFGLGSAAGEIANLIAKGKTLENELSDTNRQAKELESRFREAGSVSGLLTGYGQQLELLEGAVQSLLNSLSVIGGGLSQFVDTLGSAGVGASPIVAEAYLATLRGQAVQTQQFLE